MKATQPRSVAGFVLVGGRSSRMGTDKAMLPFSGTTFAQHLAAKVREVTGNVTLVGAPERYSHLGIPVLADRAAGFGPLGGLWTLLGWTQADWNLVVACDIPLVETGFLTQLTERAEISARRLVVPLTSQGLQPLCAVYHRSLFVEADRAIQHKSLRMIEFIEKAQAEIWNVAHTGIGRNVNTPEEWAQMKGSL